MFFERARSTRKMKSLYVLLQLREEFNQIERNDFSVQVISVLKMTAGHECNQTKIKCTDLRAKSNFTERRVSRVRLSGAEHDRSIFPVQYLRKSALCALCAGKVVSG